MFIGQTVSVSCCSYLHLGRGGFFVEMLNPKVLSNEELLIVLGRQINIDREQKAVVIDQPNSRQLWPTVACLPACLRPNVSCRQALSDHLPGVMH